MPKVNTHFNGIPIRDSPPPKALGLPSAIVQDNFGFVFLNMVYFNPAYATGGFFTVAIFRIRPKK